VRRFSSFMALSVARGCGARFSCLTFARRGRASAALSLRGHGASEGRAQLSETRLPDYCNDVRRALAEFKEPPIVVAHSLGGLLAQLLIGREEMRALVLLASLPPEGLILESPRLALTDTRIWLEAFLGSLAVSRLPIGMAAQQVLFSEGLPREQEARYATKMTPEAPRALAEAHLPQPAFSSASLFGLPTLVMSGSRDRLVSYASGWRTALYHGAQHRTVEGREPAISPNLTSASPNLTSAQRRSAMTCWTGLMNSARRDRRCYGGKLVRIECIRPSVRRS
jgi:alpha-beta hydrolase superfamily lysophospholipase